VIELAEKETRELNKMAKGEVKCDVGEKLDEFLSKLASEGGTERKVQKIVFDAIDVFENELKNHIHVFRDTMSKLRLLTADKWIDISSKKQFNQASMKESVCYGTGGMAKKPGTTDFLAMSSHGKLTMVDGITREVTKTLDIGIKGTPYCNSCVEFSPDGKKFLVSIADDKELSV
jgi:hypothetical protein